MEVYTGENSYIFISYAHDDSERVLPIISYIANQEYRIWFDQRIEVGTKWAEVIAQRLNQSACFMAFITDNYLQSDNCMDEIEHAKNKKIPILIIYLEDLQIPDWFLMRHGRTQCIYYKEYTTHNEFFGRIYESSILEDCRREEDEIDVSDCKIEKIEEILENKENDEIDEQMEQLSEESELRKNITIMKDTFSKVGLKVLNVGVEYMDLPVGKYIRFYCEVIAFEDCLEKDTEYYIKVNVYTEDDKLICMDRSIPLTSDQFTGYDTFLLMAKHHAIHEKAAKAKIYLTK